MFKDANGLPKGEEYRNEQKGKSIKYLENYSTENVQVDAEKPKLKDVKESIFVPGDNDQCL